MNKQLLMEDFLSSNSSGNVVNFDKGAFQASINPDTCNLYYSEKSNLWYAVIINSESGKSYRIGIHKDIEITPAVKKAADAGNAAAAALLIDPASKAAKTALGKAEAVVVPFVGQMLDDEAHFIYAGVSDEGRKWVRLSPNAPGAQGIASYAFATALVED